MSNAPTMVPASTVSSDQDYHTLQPGDGDYETLEPGDDDHETLEHRDDDIIFSGEVNKNSLSIQERKVFFFQKSFWVRCISYPHFCYQSHNIN